MAENGRQETLVPYANHPAARVNPNVCDQSDTAFVERGEPGVVTFERDAAGKVARLVPHLNGDDLVGIKIR